MVTTTPTPAAPNKIEPPRRTTACMMARAALRWAERGFAVFGALVAVYWLTIDVSIVVSPSMSPTLQGTSTDNGDRVVTEKVSYCFRAPHRWEIITFTSAEGEKRMKRVVGLPGESVRMTNRDELLIDGHSVDIPPMLAGPFLRFGNLMDGNPVSCGDGYYVLGDDLKDSDDSRFNGPVPSDHVIGRAWMIVWPFRRFGFVH